MTLDRVKYICHHKVTGRVKVSWRIENSWYVFEGRWNVAHQQPTKTENCVTLACLQWQSSASGGSVTSQSTDDEFEVSHHIAEPFRIALQSCIAPTRIRFTCLLCKPWRSTAWALSWFACLKKSTCLVATLNMKALVCHKWIPWTPLQHSWMTI